MRRTRSALSALTAISAAILVGAAAAWACTAARGPMLDDLFKQRSPAGTVLDLRGEGWAALMPVKVDWRPATATASAPSAPQVLTTATTDGAGKLAVSIRVPDSAADGLYLVGVTQAATTRLAPFEVASTRGPSAEAPAAASGRPGNGADPGASSAAQMGLANLPDNAGGGSSGLGLPAIVAVTAVGLTLLVGVAATEQRRRRQARVSTTV